MHRGMSIKKAIFFVLVVLPYVIIWLGNEQGMKKLGLYFSQIVTFRHLIIHLLVGCWHMSTKEGNEYVISFAFLLETKASFDSMTIE